MKPSITRSLFALALLAGLTVPTAAQGAVVLMGIDAEDGNGASGSGHGGKQPYIDVLNGLLSNVSNGGTGILVIGAGKDPFDHVTGFWTAVATGATTPFSFVNSGPTIFNASFDGFAAICVASTVHETASGGLTDAENDALERRAQDIADFVNAGGGLFGLSQEGFGNPYGYLGTLGGFTFNFPVAFDAVDATTEGEMLGITDTNLDVCCWHDEYLTFPTYLDILARNETTQNVCAVGGLVTIVQGITLTPLQETCDAVGGMHTVTAQTADSQGNAIAGASVSFEIISGPNTGLTGMGTTDSSGTTTFTYSGAPAPAGVGIDTIRGRFTDNMGMLQEDTVTKEWTCAGSTSSVYPGIPGTGGIPQISVTGCPAIGNTLTLAVTGTVPGTFGCMGLGFNFQSTPIVGGSWIVGAPYWFLASHRPNASGAYTRLERVPNDPLLAGEDFYLQAIYADPMGAVGYSFTEGIRIELAP